MKKEKKTGSIKDFKYNSFVYLKRITSSVREVLKSRFLNNCGKHKMNEEKGKKWTTKVYFGPPTRVTKFSTLML